MSAIEKEIRELVEEIKNFPIEDKNNVIMFAENNEWGIALDTLCNQLYEYDIKISIKVFNKIENIAKKMNMPITIWDFLEKLIE